MTQFDNHYHHYHQITTITRQDLKRDSVQLVAQRNALSTTPKQICSLATLSQVNCRLWQATEIHGGLSATLASGVS